MKTLCVTQFQNEENLDFLRQMIAEGVKATEIDCSRIVDIADPEALEVLDSGGKPQIVINKAFEAIKITEDGIPEKYRFDPNEPFEVAILEDDQGAGALGVKEPVQAKPGDYLLVKVCDMETIPISHSCVGEIDGRELFETLVVDEETLQRRYETIDVGSYLDDLDFAQFVDQGSAEFFSLVARAIKEDLAKRQFCIDQGHPMLAFCVNRDIVLEDARIRIVRSSFIVDGIERDIEAVVVPEHSALIFDPLLQPKTVIVATQRYFGCNYMPAKCLCSEEASE